MSNAANPAARIQILGTVVIAVLALLAAASSPGQASSGESLDRRSNQGSNQSCDRIVPAASPEGASERVRWETVRLDSAGDAIRAVAVARGTQFAVGDSRGVLVGSAPDALQRRWLRGAVRHVEFLAREGTNPPDLLVATESGLYRAGFESTGRPIAPAPGARAANVSQIVTAARATAIATDDGVFLSRDGEAWQRLGGLVPTGAASAVALRARDEGIELWAVIRGQLWRVAFETAVSGEPVSPSLSEQTSFRQTLYRQTLYRQTSAIPIALPLGPGGGDAVGIALDIGGAEVVVVFGSAIVASRVDESAKSGLGWEVLRPELAPGAVIVELVSEIGWCWLATDRGLFRSRNLGGPWRIAAGPLAARPIGDLATSGRGSDEARVDAALYVATDRGLMVATALRGEVDASKLLQHVSQDPDIGRVHQAALNYLELDPDRVRAIHRGLDLRGWLPTVGFSVSHETDRSRGSDYDEAYVSGGLRELRDFDRDRSTEWGLRLSLSWDLGDIAYHPERLDVSREAREIIELRDEVLDEVTQLYFERQRVLAEVHSLSGDRKAVPLQNRADQLAAGIDAWTGGWFSRRVHRPDPLPDSTNLDLAPWDLPSRRMTRDSGRAFSPVPNPSEKNFQ